ncbi:MAG: 5-oxoprolinase subunit PxpB [Lysobacteraceae bacterium]|nr:MAG: 5-oxoprolinase subunit PxpB [Xanthomonadaceae bacterium]
MTQAAIEALADDAWLIRLGETMHPTVNAGVHRLAASIRQAAPEWLRGLSPAYASLGVYFDPERASPDDVRAWLAKAIGAADAGSTARTDDHNDHDCVRIVEIPVAYGEDFGADFVSAARTLDLPAQALIERHCAPLYQVAMIGFAPGFPYLLGLDPTLTLPRLSTPRTHVPAGSVAIGGAQTGIYPRASPGGWRLIGRTPLRMFEPSRAPPALLRPGDRVRFRAISADEFAILAAAA